MVNRNLSKKTLSVVQSICRTAFLLDLNCYHKWHRLELKSGIYISASVLHAHHCLA